VAMVGGLPASATLAEAAAAGYIVRDSTSATLLRGSQLPGDSLMTVCITLCDTSQGRPSHYNESPRLGGGGGAAARLQHPHDVRMTILPR